MSEKKETAAVSLNAASIWQTAVHKYAMFIALIAIALFFQWCMDGVLLAPMNISKLIMQNSYILILAIGMLPCILTGDIDLSVGSVVAVIGAVAATMIVSMGMSVPVTIISCIALGLLIGAWLGTIIGAVVGGLVMGVLNNGMSIMGVGIDWQQAIKGMVLLAAVAFDIYNQSTK